MFPTFMSEFSLIFVFTFIIVGLKVKVKLFPAFGEFHPLPPSAACDRRGGTGTVLWTLPHCHMDRWSRAGPCQRLFFCACKSSKKDGHHFTRGNLDGECVNVMLTSFSGLSGHPQCLCPEHTAVPSPLAAGTLQRQVPILAPFADVLCQTEAAFYEILIATLYIIDRHSKCVCEHFLCPYHFLFHLPYP